MNYVLKNYAVVGTILISMLGICVIVSVVTASWVLRDETSQEVLDHHWIHEELGLDEEDVPELEEMEVVYSADKNKLLGELAVLQARLSQQLLEKSEADEEISETVKKIHHVHGKIQELGIKHYFDMISILPEPKQRRLRELAVDALSGTS